MGKKRWTSEERRNKLIDKLISCNVYKIDDKQLYQLTLPELENEYSKFQSLCHPHGEISSLQWKQS